MNHCSYYGCNNILTGKWLRGGICYRCLKREAQHRPRRCRHGHPLPEGGGVSFTTRPNPNCNLCRKRGIERRMCQRHQPRLDLAKGLNELLALKRGPLESTQEVLEMVGD